MDHGLRPCPVRQWHGQCPDTGDQTGQGRLARCHGRSCAPCLSAQGGGGVEGSGGGGLSPVQRAQPEASGAQDRDMIVGVRAFRQEAAGVGARAVGQDQRVMRGQGHDEARHRQTGLSCKAGGGTAIGAGGLFQRGGVAAETQFQDEAVGTVAGHDVHDDAPALCFAPRAEDLRHDALWVETEARGRIAPCCAGRLNQPCAMIGHGRVLVLLLLAQA